MNTENSRANIQGDGGVATKQSSALISVVIPVYNEDEQNALETCLREVRKTLEDYGHPWEIIFVDDCSRDGSLAKLLTFLDGDKITVIEHTRNLGAVKAILSGMRASRGDVTIPFDPDLQFAPACIPQLAEQVLKGYDFVGGIRVSRQDSLFKRLTSRVSSSIINHVMGIRQVDFGSIKAYNRKMINGILSLPPDYMAIQAAAFSLSRNFIEIPIEHRQRAVGESKFTFLTRLDLFLDIYASYSRHPLTFMMLTGVFLLLAGAIISGGVMASCLIFGQPFTALAATATVAGVLLLLAGLNFMFLSILGQFVVRTFRRSSTEAERGIVRIHRRASP
jgi:undecaprenyl-phosphate 4-deoxy-4-formamido-L-arabinose transferase